MQYMQSRRIHLDDLEVDGAEEPPILALVALVGVDVQLK
jgi:hypothetical protein